MAKDFDLEIKEILGELNEVNSKNEQKVVAVASWNGRPDTIDIRRYNVIDEILTKGISLTPEEAGELVYILLQNPEYVKYDSERVQQILKQKEESEVNVEQLVEQLQSADNDDNESREEPNFVQEEDEFATATYGNRRVVPKNKNMFARVYKK